MSKNTLPRAVAGRQDPAVFLDRERAADRALLAEPENFLPRVRERLVVLDEVQHLSQIFAALQPEIDAHRVCGRFLVPGSDSGVLLHLTGESLAGHVAYNEIAPVLTREMPTAWPDLQQLWLRGGFPPSCLASSDVAAFAWRQDCTPTVLQRDLPGMGVRVPAATLRCFWTMLAQLQGQICNASALGRSPVGVSHTAAARYLDTLPDTLMLRRLPHFQVGRGNRVGKRLVKSPKVCVRDSGGLHELLGLASVRDLQGHPVASAPSEGFVVEQLAAALPAGSQPSFHRVALGAELDLAVELGTCRFGIEIKFFGAPKPARGFWQSAKGRGIERAWVVAPVACSLPLAPGGQALPVHEISRAIEDMI